MRAPMTLALTAVRYAEPARGKEVMIHADPLFSIPEAYLRPLLRCLLATGAKLPNETFTAAESEAAKPFIAGQKEPPRGYRPLAPGEYPLDVRKWY